MQKLPQNTGELEQQSCLMKLAKENRFYRRHKVGSQPHILKGPAAYQVLFEKECLIACHYAMVKLLVGK